MELSVSLPYELLNYIWSFADIDTRLKNGIKPQKLIIFLNWKQPELGWLHDAVRHYIKQESYIIDYIYLRKHSWVRVYNGTYIFDEHMKIKKELILD